MRWFPGPTRLAHPTQLLNFGKGFPTMNRWLGVCSVAFLLVASTGCLHHGVRGGACKSCGPSTCSTGSCQSGSCGDSCGGSCEPASEGRVGILSRLKGRSACGNCGSGGCGCASRIGCQPGPLGWQQGGLNYSSHLQPGFLGHQAGQQLNQTPFQPGPPTAAVGYPYYTIRGPRDFLVDNPPTIGR